MLTVLQGKESKMLMLPSFSVSVYLPEIPHQNFFVFLSVRELGKAHAAFIFSSKMCKIYGATLPNCRDKNRIRIVYLVFSLFYFSVKDKK